MKAAPLLISWHNDNTPIYSAHFEPHGRGRLATGGGDNNVRIWKVEKEGDERTVTYLTTLIKVIPLNAMCIHLTIELTAALAYASCECCPVCSPRCVTLTQLAAVSLILFR